MCGNARVSVSYLIVSESVGLPVSFTVWLTLIHTTHSHSHLLHSLPSQSPPTPTPTPTVRYQLRHYAKSINLTTTTNPRCHRHHGDNV